MERKMKFPYNYLMKRFLFLYYLDDLSSPPIEEEILNSPNQTETVWKYISQWIQYDEKLPMIFEKYAAILKAGA